MKKVKLEQVRRKLLEQELDAILVTSPYNRRYMTNFTGTAGVAIITQTEALFITDFRYTTQATEEAKEFTVIEHSGLLLDEIATQLSMHRVANVGFEADDMTYDQYKIYEAKINAKLVPLNGFFASLREIKTLEEIHILEEAAKMADDAFEHILTVIKPGILEIDVANELEFFMRRKGATSSSFDTIVASGWRSALPHGVASQKKIETGELVTLDFGAYYKGYCSDITRTIAVGDVNDQLKEIYDVVLEAQKLGVANIKAGMTGKEADDTTRDYITKKGYGQYFGHSTGHGIGLEVHEGPSLSQRSSTVLRPNMVVTVEPGIYIPDVGGCRIEDDIVITEDGNRIITHSPKELIIV